MKNNVPFVIVISGMACVFRLICEEIETGNDDFVLLVMAFINCFALLFVLYLLLHNAYCMFKEKVEKFTIDYKEKVKVINCIRKIVNIVILIILGILGIGYMKVYSNVTNDILSIVALGLSIISDDVSESLAECLVVAGKRVLQNR